MSTTAGAVPTTTAAAHAHRTWTWWILLNPLNWIGNPVQVDQVDHILNFPVLRMCLTCYVTLGSMSRSTGVWMILWFASDDDEKSKIQKSKNKQTNKQKEEEKSLKIWFSWSHKTHIQASVKVYCCVGCLKNRLIISCTSLLRWVTGFKL